MIKVEVEVEVGYNPIIYKIQPQKLIFYIFFMDFKYKPQPQPQS
jgi:hypothetical protein